VSLLDALLLDGYRVNTWLAWRTDGIKGTGSLNDPLDASTKFAAPVMISGLTRTGLQANVTTTAPHGYDNGDVVTIDGVTGPSAPLWNGTFPIFGASGTIFNYYMTATPVDTMPGGTKTASKVLAFRFDDVMNSLPANARVHLGPTAAGRPFLTRGYADGVSGGFQPKAGMKIVGSGIDVTLLQLVPQENATAHFYAIGHSLTTGTPPAPNLLDYFEVSDLTIDCNLVIRPSIGAACGAVRVLGNHTLVRRVKAIRWGTRTMQKGCFVIAVLTGDPDLAIPELSNMGIEECIAVDPAEGSVREVTVLHVGGKETLPAFEAMGRGPFIRKCFVDAGALANPLTLDIRALSMTWCRAGLVEGNQVQNVKHGGPHHDKTSAAEVVVRGNYYRNVARGPYYTLGQLEPPSAQSLVSLVRDPSDGTIALATTNSSPSVPHGLVSGHRVRVDASAGSPSQYKGLFVVKDVPAPNQFRYQMGSDPLGNASDPNWQKVFGLGKVSFEGNTFELATGTTGLLAIYLHDNALTRMQQKEEYVYGQVIIGDNRFRYTDGLFGAYNGSALQVNGAKNLIVRESVVEVYPFNPLKNERCGTAKYFNNKTPTGQLVQGFNEDTDKKYDELETEAEDALVLALLRR
jgi:hypothetical protein